MNQAQGHDCCCLPMMSLVQRDGWVQALEYILGSESVRDDYTARGHKQVDKYTWDRVARATWDIYRRVAS